MNQTKSITTKTNGRLIPDYLRKTYWWAYLHPRGVKFFERQWLVNLILFGNYNYLCDQVIEQIQGTAQKGGILQIACAYGNLTPRLASLLDQNEKLDVIDVARIQLKNLKRKLSPSHNVQCYLQDSTNLNFPSNNYKVALLFFLLHEQPLQQRIDTLKEALRVTDLGGQVVIVDYHRPSYWFPLRYLLFPFLKLLEPYAKDLWQYDINEWLPSDIPPQNIHKQTYFGGLYQKLVITKPM